MFILLLSCILRTLSTVPRINQCKIDKFIVSFKEFYWQKSLLITSFSISVPTNNPILLHNKNLIENKRRILSILALFLAKCNETEHLTSVCTLLLSHVNFEYIHFAQFIDEFRFVFPFGLPHKMHFNDRL